MHITTTAPSMSGDDQLLHHLLTRRSVPAPRLLPPGPKQDEIATMLTAAVRVPDHGKLAPWRFIVADGDGRARLVDRLMGVWRAANPDASEQAVEIERGKLGSAPTLVAVVSRAGPHVKIPEWEQQLSAGAVCMNLLHAAYALGYAAQWLTGWAAYDPAAARLLGIDEGERIAGFVHVGTPPDRPPERERPDVAALTTYWRER